MQIKAADDRRADIDALQRLAVRSDVELPVRRRIEKEIRTLTAGIQGEQEAAYQIEFYFGSSSNWVSIHDLRLEHDGRFAQIDHLLINRVLQVWVCESKHFSESVEINAEGEWVRTYQGRRYGVDSPIEQNRRHLDVLNKVLRSGSVPLPRRLVTMRPELRSLVLVSNNAVIRRPRTKVVGIDQVIKAERLKSEVFDKFDDGVRTMVARLVSPATIEKLGRELVALHRPVVVDWAARFGLTAPEATSRTPGIPPNAAVVGRGAPADPSGRACERCGGPTSFAEVAYCRYNARRFGNGTYCRTCQPMVSPSS